MRAINHALTGAVIGLSVGNPIVAVPIALLSHFICDAIPHFGMGEASIKTKTFRNILVTDALLCVGLVSFLAIAQPAYWLLAAICAFVAVSPDLLWLPLYKHAKQGKTYVRKGFYKFAADIQWFERPIGSVVEVAWLGAGLFLVGSLALIW